MLGEIGGGYELTRDWFTEERLMIGARTIGAAIRALELTAKWARERDPGRRPPHRPPADRGDARGQRTEIATNRALTHQVAQEFDRGGDRKTLHAKAAMVKLASSEASDRILDRCVQILGGRGYMREQAGRAALARAARRPHLGGDAEVQRLVIANEIDKRGLDGLLAFAAARSAPGQREQLLLDLRPDRVERAGGRHGGSSSITRRP